MSIRILLSLALFAVPCMAAEPPDGDLRKVSLAGWQQYRLGERLPTAMKVLVDVTGATSEQAARPDFSEAAMDLVDCLDSAAQTESKYRHLTVDSFAKACLRKMIDSYPFLDKAASAGALVTPPKYEAWITDIEPGTKLVVNCVLEAPVDQITLEQLASEVYERENGKDYKDVFILWYLLGSEKGFAWNYTNFVDGKRQ